MAGRWQTVNAMQKYPGSQEPNETGFSLANNTDATFFEVLSQFPERARRFANSMRAFTEVPGYDMSHVVDGFPWADLGHGTVVDVGGSQGFASFAIASAFPDLSFVVQDAAPVIAAAEKQAPVGLAHPVKFMTHDFFTEQPVHGADVYFLRWVLHDWSDKYSLKILRNLVPALKPGAKVVVMDAVLPKPGVLPRWQDDKLRYVLPHVMVKSCPSPTVG